MWSPSRSHGSSLTPRRITLIAGLTLALSGAATAPALAAPRTVDVNLSPATSEVAAYVNPAGDPYEPIGYGESVTVQFPAGVTPSGLFVLRFYDDYPSTWSAPPGYEDTFSTDASDPTAGPLTVTDLGGNSVQIDIPPVTEVDFGPQAHKAELSFTLDTTIPGAAGDPNGDNVHFLVSVGGPASVSLPSHLVLSSELPTVAVTAGDSVRLTLPTSSALYVAGLTSLSGADLSLHKANAGNLQEDWGPAEQVGLTVADDGLSATMSVPKSLSGGVYALRVVRRLAPASTDAYVSTALLVNLTGTNKGLRSDTGWGEDSSTPANGLPWAVFAGAGMLVVAAATAGGALVLTRRRSGGQA